MRKIKFRAWCDSMGFTIHELKPGEEIYIDSETKTIQQFTGLLDKNGNDIYEGDIVEPATMNDNNLNLWTMINGQSVKKRIEIKWNKEYAGFEIQLPTSDLKVIGNIYENSELLVGEK